MISLLLAFTAVLTDPLEWVYPDSRVDDFAEFAAIDVPSDGLVSANVLFNGLEPGEPVELEASAKGGGWCELRSVPVEFNSGPLQFVEKRGETNEFAVRRAPYRVYDALRPLAEAVFTPTSSVAAVRFAIEAKELDSSWPFVDFTFRQAGERVSKPLKVRVHAVSSAAASPDEAFAYVNWASFSNMAERHGLELWSDTHYAMIDRYLALAARNRQNAVWLSSDVMFDEGADGVCDVLATNRLDRLMEIFNRNGLYRIQGGHLCGRDGWFGTNLYVRATRERADSPAGIAELRRLTGQINGFIARHHLEKRYMQQVMDEPTVNSRDSFCKACGAIRRLMPGVPLTDAVTLDGFEGALDIVCPGEYRWWQHRDSFEYARTNCGQRVWCYTCLAPGGPWLNRLLDMEVLRPVYLFTAAAAHGMEGYLHWGYNHWQPQQNPFEMSCITNWTGDINQTLPAGDTHIVYPGDDGPWSSVRLEATRQGMEDCELYRKLRTLDPELAETIRAKTVREFNDFERDVRKYRLARRELLVALERAQPVSEIVFTKPAIRWLWGGFGFHNSEASMTPRMSQEFLNERVLKGFREISPTYSRVFAGFADWTRSAMDAWADYYDRTFAKAGTVLYLVPGRMPTITTDFDLTNYCEKVAANLEYLVKVRGCDRVRYYCVANELSVGNQYAWFATSGNLPLFKAINEELFRAFRRHDLDIGLMAPDSSGPSRIADFDWALENMDEITDTYSWHYYLRGCEPGDPRVYGEYYDNLTNLVALAHRREKRVSLGEWGFSAMDVFKAKVMRNDVGYSYSNATNASLVAIARAEIGLAALNAGCATAVNWTFCDYPDPFFGDGDDVSRFSGFGTSIRYNKWGLFRWCDDEHDYSSYPDLYTMGYLVKLFRRGARVLPWTCSDRSLRVGGVTNPDGSASFAVVNWGEAKTLRLVLPVASVRPYRVYEYDSAKVPFSAFNDLQPAKGTVRAAGDRLSVEVPARSMVFLTTDYVERVPPEVEDVEIERGRLVWEPVDDPDHVYYRVFRNGEQIRSTVATWCEIDDLSAKYEVKSVDRWGNVRK